MGTEKKYPLKVTTGVLKQLGINLYSNVPAVLTEVVANAWDADATKVYIHINNKEGYITIEDNGHGMTYESLINKYLNVGYERRGVNGEYDKTPSGRPVMGRKGVGKLAPFSIADIIEVYTTSNGEKNAIQLDAKEIEEKGDKGYDAVSLDTNSCPENNGTIIRLKRLKKGKTQIPSLKARFARRFSVIETKEFRVFIKREGKDIYEEVTAKDREDLTSLQYIWTFGDYKAPRFVTVPKNRRMHISGELDSISEKHKGWKIKGWIGTSSLPKNLKKDSGNINIIAVLARGRLFEENILSKINNSGHFVSYITGSIEADFIDDSTKKDMATSDRQRIDEHDERSIYLNEWLRQSLNKIGSKWSEWRKEDSVKEIKNKYPGVNDWINSFLSVKIRRLARNFIGLIGILELDDKDRDIFILNSIKSFESLKLNESESELSNVNINDNNAFWDALNKYSSMVNSAHRAFFYNRSVIVDAIVKRFKTVGYDDTLKDFLCDNLWVTNCSCDFLITPGEIDKLRGEVRAKINNDKRNFYIGCGRFMNKTIVVCFDFLDGIGNYNECEIASYNECLHENASKYYNSFEVIYFVSKKYFSCFDNIIHGKGVVFEEQLMRNQHYFNKITENMKNEDSIKSIMASIGS